MRMCLTNWFLNSSNSVIAFSKFFNSARTAANNLSSRSCSASTNDETKFIINIKFGRGEIRTHGPVSRATVFKTVPLDHSGTLPKIKRRVWDLNPREPFSSTGAPGLRHRPLGEPSMATNYKFITPAGGINYEYTNPSKRILLILLHTIKKQQPFQPPVHHFLDYKYK